MPPAPARTRLELELDSTDDPIQGRIGYQNGQPVPFTGWLELIAAVERLTSGQRTESTPPAHGSNTQ